MLLGIIDYMMRKIMNSDRYNKSLTNIIFNTKFSFRQPVEFLPVFLLWDSLWKSLTIQIDKRVKLDSFWIIISLDLLVFF